MLQYFAVRITNTGSYWQAPLGVRSAKRRHQSPEWMILINVNCFIQGEVIGFQVLLDSLHPCSTRASWWSPPVLQGEPVKVLAFVSSSSESLTQEQGSTTSYSGASLEDLHTKYEDLQLLYTSRSGTSEVEHPARWSSGLRRLTLMTCQKLWISKLTS